MTMCSAADRSPRGSNREVREKRGLAYGVSDQLLWLYHAAVHVGGNRHPQ